MKLAAEGPDKLILDVPQWGWRLRGVIIMLIGLIGVIYMDVNYQINCQQKSIGKASECSLQTRVYGYHLLATPINALLGAFVQRTGYDANNHSNLYAIQLKTSSGLVALTEGSSSGWEDKEKIANAINDYVKYSAAPKFKVPDSKFLQYFMQLIFGILFLIGLIILLGVSNIKVILDKLTETVTIRHRWLFFSKTKSYAWSEVLKFDIQEKVFNVRSRNTMCRILLRLSNFEIKPLTRFYSKNSKTMNDVVDKMNFFLGRTQNDSVAKN